MVRIRFIHYFIIAMFFDLLKSEMYIGDIYCYKKFRDYDCSVGCRGFCPNNCLQKSGEVYGTVFYHKNSYICKSAIHDLRISMWNYSSAQEIRFKEVNGSRMEFKPTFRQRIQSKGSFPSTKYFVFTNPRVSEKVHDVISLHHNYLNNGIEEHEQECRILATYNQSIYFTNGNYTKATFSSTELSKNPSYKKYSKIWNNVNTRTGFWCRTRFSSFSDIFSIAISKNVTFISKRFTVTVSKGDYVDVSQLLNLKNIEIENKLKINGVKSAVKNYYNKAIPISISDAGLFSLIENNTLAATRLIVRVCEVGKYGPLCEYNCSNCFNGGVCHDITGECICPPGFNGTYCETACPAYYFGKHCNQQCYDKSGNVTDCSEILFCLPDPYGCSCLSGYLLPFCNEICENGRYGVNCLQNCSQNCNATCNPFNGTCIDGCKQGWHGDMCQISYPVLKSNVTVRNITSDSVVVHFHKWNKDTDEGEGTPFRYYIEFQDTKSAVFNRTSVKHTENPSYSIRIENLHADTQYIFQIYIQDETGDVQYHGIPGVRVTTLCTTPPPPNDVILRNEGPRRISVKWNNPFRKVGQCDGSTVFINYLNFNTSENLNTTVQEYPNTFVFNTKPYTMWHIKIRYLDINGIYSNWSKTEMILSEQDAPSQVRNLRYEIQNSSLHQYFLLTWEKPEEENGIIVNYYIEYAQIGWRHYCHATFEKHRAFNVSSNTYNTSISVRRSAIYLIAVSAFTVRKGPDLSIDGQSLQDVPYSVLKDLRVTSWRRALKLSWSPPDCSLSNGNINSYKLIITSKDPWDSRNDTKIVRVTTFSFENLIPFTSYDIRIFARNDIGFSYKSVNITSKTLSEKPPAPYDLQVIRKTNRELSLKWKLPYPPHGILEGYGISYKCNENKCEHRQLRTIWLSVDKVSCDHSNYHCYTINNLEAKKEYIIYIRAKNKDVKDYGDWSSITDETKESVPDPPEKANLENSTEYSFKISWDSPKRENGILKTYRINITAIKSFNETVSGTSRFNIVNATQRQYAFENLYPATLYNVSIEASTSAGYGSPLNVQFTTNHSVPIIEVEPAILEVTDSTIDLLIKPIKFDKGPISEYHVIVERKGRLQKREIKVEEKELINYNTSMNTSVNYYSTARFYPRQLDSEGINFTVGDGKTYNDFYNAPLITGENYQLGMAVLSNYNGKILIGYKYLSDVIKVERSMSKGTDKSSLIGVLFGILACLIIIIALIGYRKRNLLGKVKKENGFNVKFLNKKNDDELIVSSTNPILDECSENKINEKQIDGSTEISIENLEDYIIDSTETGKLKRQFMAVKKGQCKSWDMSKLPVNKPKNRYGNLLAYDETRVVLQIYLNDPYSDYINANYVDGYKRPKRYIATQGPKQTTIHDFWRMVCQENVCKIVMVTNLEENGKTKCEKYWPETEETYGNINVSLKDTEIYLDYVIRTFIITQGERAWMLKHFHYITWPDHDVPRFTNSVVSFLQKVRHFNPKSNSPIVVHCSAGVGRTGTLILLDSMVDMANSENKVDLVSHLTSMRQQRINIVETYEQYRFVYRALADCLCEFKTSILCSDYNEEIDRLKKVNASTGKTGFHIQYERLEKLRPKIKPADCRSGYETDNQLRNRNLNVVPPERARVILRGCDSESNYINAVYIDGYKQKDSFIVTQVPLPNTVSDFWRMMLLSESNTLILLNELDEVCPSYWPSLNDTINYGNTEVSNISAEMYDCIIIRTFRLRDLTRKGATTKTIKQFHLNNWPSNSYIPNSDENILHLIDRVEKWQQQTGTLTSVVQCLDGVRACGIYCTCVFVLDKIKAEQEVDVFLAVRCIRGNRPQLIENLEQFVLCYRVATTYLDSFQIYANFQ